MVLKHENGQKLRNVVKLHLKSIYLKRGDLFATRELSLVKKMKFILYLHE